MIVYSHLIDKIKQFTSQRSAQKVKDADIKFKKRNKKIKKSKVSQGKNERNTGEVLL